MDYSKEFIESVRRVGDSPPPEDRYQQERQLFGFFVSGIAALDSFNFFLYFAAAHLQPAKFPTQQPDDPTDFVTVKPDDLWKITRKHTATLFGEAFRNESITTALNNLITDTELKTWIVYRNILAHRSAPGREFFESFGSSSPSPATDWKMNLPGRLKIDVSLTPPFQEWLVKELADLVGATDQFSKKYF